MCKGLLYICVAAWESPEIHGVPLLLARYHGSSLFVHCSILMDTKPCCHAYVATQRLYRILSWLGCGILGYVGCAYSVGTEHGPLLIMCHSAAAVITDYKLSQLVYIHGRPAWQPGSDGRYAGKLSKSAGHILTQLQLHPALLKGLLWTCKHVHAVQRNMHLFLRHVICLGVTTDLGYHL